MIVILNSACFYLLLSSYFTWFRGATSEYMSYVNSSISAITIIVTEKTFGPVIACKLLSGFLLYDTGHILSNLDLYKKKRKLHITFLCHHIFTFALCSSTYPIDYPTTASNLLMVERTIPIGNLLWFSKFYNFDPLYRVLIKIIFFVAYTYYRIYHLSYIIYQHYHNTKEMFSVYFGILILLINYTWYFKAIQKIGLSFSKKKIPVKY